MEFSKGKKLVVIIVLITLIGSGYLLFKEGKSKTVKLAISTEKAVEKPIEKSIEQIKLEKFKNAMQSFKELDMSKEQINLSFEGRAINLQLPIYVRMNKYYIPLNDVVYNIGGESELASGVATIKLKDRSVSINTLNDTYKIGNDEYSFAHKPILSGEILYVSLFDFTKIFNIKTDWNYEKKAIGLFYNIDDMTVEASVKSEKSALVRFEDVTTNYNTEEQLSKLRIISDFLYKKNIPFHIAWIPRFVVPADNIDNDLTTNYSISNCNFLFTIDYFIHKNGVIGIHGYTHQNGNEVSGEGTEFSPTINAGEKETRERIEKAIETAKKLEIPYDFFESPHYAASAKQLKIAEEYFNIIYQDKENKKVTSKVKVGDRTVTYVPTPLDYVPSNTNGANVINNVDKLAENSLGSFFYHPYNELKFISLSYNENGYPTYKYTEDSILKRIINKLETKGFKFEKITSLK
jgi:hypothetical protein